MKIKGRHIVAIQGAIGAVVIAGLIAPIVFSVAYLMDVLFALLGWDSGDAMEDRFHRTDPDPY